VGEKLPDTTVSGNTELTKPENRAFYPAFDGLRALAFLAVFFWHYEMMPWGWAGVDVFFVLSGFLITGILFDTRNEPHKVKNFFIRRTLRIFPLYYGIFVVLLISEPFVHWQWGLRWAAWALYLGNIVPHFHPYAFGGQRAFAEFALLPGGRQWGALHFGHFWTLCVEEQFYVVWPWIVFWVRDRRKLLWICVASLPICLALRIAAPHVLPAWLIQEEVVAHVTIFRVDDLLWGGCLALMLRGPAGKTLLRWAMLLTPVAFALLAVWFALTPGHHFFATPYPYPATYLTFGLTTISLLSGLVILVALQPGNWLSRTLTLPPLRWIGRLSYGAYVFHDIFHEYVQAVVRHFTHYALKHNVNVGVKMVAHQSALVSGLALPLTFVLAWLSFHFFETPFLNLKNRWTVAHTPTVSALPGSQLSDSGREQAA